MVEAVVNGVTTRYRYDGEGRRIKKTVGTAVTRFVYGMGGELFAEHEGLTATPSTPSKEYVYGPTGMLAEVTGTNVNYLTPDHLGSPRVLTSQNGIVVNRRDFFPFGEDIAVGVGGRSAGMGYGTDSLRQRFTGYQKDEETGLDFAQARYYANALGRFQSADPFGGSGRTINPQTWNRFTYCLNNPITFVDPLGLQSKSPGGEPPAYEDPPSAPPIAKIEAEPAYNPSDAVGMDGLVALGRGAKSGGKKVVKRLGETLYNHFTDPVSLATGGLSTGISNAIDTVSELGTIYVEYANDPDALHEAIVDSANTVGLAGIIEAGADATTQVVIEEVIVQGVATIPKGGTYKLIDPKTGKVVRTGRTKTLQSRRNNHKNDPKLKDYDFEVDRRTDSYPAQRGREQIIHDQYQPPLNKIRPINPKNPRYAEYMKEGKKL